MQILAAVTIPCPSLYLNSAAYGCTVESCKAQAKYKIALEGIACSTSDVRQHPNWTNLIRNRNAYMIQSGYDDEETMTNELMTNGCDAVKYYQEQLCVETLANLGFSLWCPVECGCRVPDGGYYDVQCPPSCEQWRTTYDETLADLPCEDASALNFTSGSSAAFLELHLTTFEHGFYYILEWDAHESDVVWWLLTTYNCSELPLEYCGVPKRMRAVCPVICGFQYVVVVSAALHSQPNPMFFVFGVFFSFGANTEEPATNGRNSELSR